MQINEALVRAQEAAGPDVGRGRLAEYIPSLAAVDPRQFGMAIASCDGQVYVIGDADDVHLAVAGGDRHPELSAVRRRQAGDVLSRRPRPHVGTGGLLRAHQGLVDLHLTILAHPDPASGDEIAVGRHSRKATSLEVGDAAIRPSNAARVPARRMFWLRWKTLSGSTASLSAVSRASFSGGYARRTPAAPSSPSTLT